MLGFRRAESIANHARMGPPSIIQQFGEGYLIFLIRKVPFPGKSLRFPACSIEIVIVATVCFESIRILPEMIVTVACQRGARCESGKSPTAFQSFWQGPAWSHPYDSERGYPETNYDASPPKNSKTLMTPVRPFLRCQTSS